MKIAHIADLHCCREHAEEALTSLRCFTEHIKKSPVDVVCIAGDTWDSSMLCTEGSGFNRFVDAIREIADIAPVAMIYGTPSHDTDGSLEVFRKITCEQGITILVPGQAYFLLNKGEIIPVFGGNNTTYENNLKPKALLFGIPEPRKKYLLADTSTGKDETEETIREAMHKLCFFLAAKRKEHPDLPCVVLYHGEVAGSVLQNDQTVERGTGISITIDDLADIGADYYALGHIHKPQQVGNLPAYYAGSIYPKNFGETHQAGFNVVTIHNGEYLLERVDFPHPQNVKLEFSLNKQHKPGDQIDFAREIIARKKVWAEITCKKDQRAFVDTDAELQNLLDNGAVSGSRVTINELATETVRAADITEAPTPEKKLEIWAEQSQVTVTEDHLDKVKLLAGDISKKSGAPSGEWELVSVRLRGAVGIQLGIGKDEIFLDFEKYDAGLIALCGENGKGKTTLIENCHPYPQLFTRRGKLQDHFCLKDSFREVIYRNKIDGSMYKCLIQIDGQNKSGACKYFVFNIPINMSGPEFAEPIHFGSSKDMWLPLSGIDGNLKPYEEFVRATFGPPELYLRTAFNTQRPARNLPDLTDATQGDKKALFTALAGIDYLQQFADLASERQRQEQARAHDAELKAGMLEDAVNKKEELVESLESEKDKRKFLETSLEKIVSDGQAAKEALAKAEAEAAAEKERERRYQEVADACTELNIESARLTREKNSLLELSRNRGDYQEKIDAWEKAAETARLETEKKSQAAEKNARKQAEYAEKLKAHNEVVRKAEAAADDLTAQRDELRRMIQAEETEIRLHERDAAEIEDTCPTCGQVLPEENIEMLRGKQKRALEFIEVHRKEIERFRDQVTKLEEEIARKKTDIAALVFEVPRSETPEPFDDAILKGVLAAMSMLDIENARQCLAKAAEAGVRIEGIENQLADKSRRLREKEAEKDSIHAAGNPEAPEKYEAARLKHEDLIEEYRKGREAAAVSKERISALEAQIADAAAKEDQLAGLQETIGEANSEAAEWEVIVRAFGKDGIQALELDALAPGISDTANRILDSAFGGRFAIGIETTRIGGTGRKTKQIEDFIITVSDMETGGEPVPLEMKSGGESVWIKRAIYDAFALIRKRNTGFHFRTCFQDESDGALDSAAKTAYCRMLEAAHAESKIRHTVIITHSEEVKAMIPQKINMEELA